MQNYIDEKMKEFAMDIADYSIGEMVIDEDKLLVRISDKTVNGIEVFIKAKSKKGIDSKQWFEMRQFNRRFRKNIVIEKVSLGII